MHFLKITEWSVSTWTTKMLAKHVFWRLMFFYTHLLLQLQPSVLWHSIDVKPPTKWIWHEFDASWVPTLKRLHSKTWPRLRGLADWENRLGGSPHPSCKRNQSETRDYMDRRGGLPHLNGLPHLPRVPHLHDGKSLFTVGDIETLSLNAATSGNKTTHTSPFPLCSKLWCLLSSYWYLESGTTLHRGGGGGKD